MSERASTKGRETFPDLTHYSRKPLGKITSTRQVVEPDSKPRGLWVSDDAEYSGEAMGWPHWCQAESFALDRLARRSVVDKKQQKWVAYIGVSGRTLHLGRFDDLEEAAAKRAEAEAKYYSEFSNSGGTREPSP